MKRQGLELTFTKQHHILIEMAQTILKFLKKLKNNNNKPWFDDNRDTYEAAKTEFLNITGDLIKIISKFDKSVSALEPKACIFRINRDVRFSNDKTPYKSNFAAVIGPKGKKTEGPCYYFNIEPGKSFIAGGLWMPAPEILKKIREEIDYNGDKLVKILSQKSFKSFFDGFEQEHKLQRPPEGFSKDHEHIDLIKLKSFTVYHTVPDKIIVDPSFFKLAEKGFKEIFSLNTFLGSNLE